MGENGLMLLFVIGLVVIIVLIRYFVPKITKKASMAVRNKIVRYEEKKNPPQKMNLADLYGEQAQSSERSAGSGNKNL